VRVTRRVRVAKQERVTRRKRRHVAPEAPRAPGVARDATMPSPVAAQAAPETEGRAAAALALLVLAASSLGLLRVGVREAT